MYFNDCWLLNVIRKHLPYFIFCLFFLFLFLDPIPGGDSLNYYALTTSLFHDLDIDLTNQTGIIFPGLSFDEIVIDNSLLKWNGKFLYSDHTPGFSLVVLPFYSICFLLGQIPLFHFNDAFFLSLRGDILIHLLAPCLATLFFFVLAFVFCLRILEYFKIKNPGLWFSLAFLSTNVLHYASVDSAYPQITELSLFSIFLYYFLLKKNSFLQGLSLGLAILIKPYFLGIAFLVFIYKLWKKEENIFSFVLPILLFLCLWGAYNNAVYGSPFETGFNSSFSSSFSFSLIPLHFFSILFSPTNGFLFFTPFVLLGFFGLLFSFLREISKRKITEKSLFFLFFLGYLLFFSSQGIWAESGSFAHKTFCFFFPLVILGTYEFYKGVKLPFFQKEIKLPLWFFYLLAIYTLIIWILFLNNHYLSEFFLLIQNLGSFDVLSRISFLRVLSIL